MKLFTITLVLTILTAAAQNLPNAICNPANEGSVSPIPANGDMLWICKSGDWIPFDLIPSTGTSKSLPGDSCKHIKDTVGDNCNQPPQNGTYWVRVAEVCSGEKKPMEIYCDMTTWGGGWSLVWKHSYMQVGNLTEDMYYYSSHHKPCKDLSVGWCNVRDKMRLNPKEMMIVAYHNGTPVYAYNGTFNCNIDHNWQGAILLPRMSKILDKCQRYRDVKPTPIEHDDLSGLSGLIFGKRSSSPGSWSSTSTDTIKGTLADPVDARWEDCYLPSSISIIKNKIPCSNDKGHLCSLNTTRTHIYHNT
jgi:hypothetical protein